MYGTPITVVGNVVDEIVVRPTSAGVPRLSFRIASTERRRDRDTGEWVDGRTLWVSVTLWRDLAENAGQSIRKGDPVVAHGLVYTRQWIKDETNRVSLELECDSIGHDLSRGVAVFSKRRRGALVAAPDESVRAVLDHDALAREHALVPEGAAA